MKNIVETWSRKGWDTASDESIKDSLRKCNWSASLKPRTSVWEGIRQLDSLYKGAPDRSMLTVIRE